MSALTLAVAVLALAGCAAGRAGPARRAGSAGVTVELPPGWHTTAGNDGSVIDPLTRVVVASSPITASTSACQTSSYAFADDAVALVLVEWQGPALTPGTKHPPRPPRFTPESLGIRRGVHECCAVLDSLEVRPAKARSGVSPPPPAPQSGSAR